MKPDENVNAALHNLAVLFLKRPLSTAEEEELRNFQQNAANQKVGSEANAPAEKAKILAANTIQEGRKRADSAIRNILETIRGTTEQAIQAQEREEKAITEVLEAARSLRSLQPTTTPSSEDSTVQHSIDDSQSFLPQIADRLGNLVKTAVKECFDQQFGSLQGELEKALTELKAITQPAIENSSSNMVD